MPEYLFVRFLERYHPVLYALLRVVGFIEDNPEPLDPIDPTRPPYVRRLVIWDNLVALVGDPAGQLQSLYHWDDGQPFAHARLLTELAGLAAAMNIRHRHLPPRPKLVDDEYGGELPAADVRELALPVVRASPGGVHTEQGLVLAPVPPKPGRLIDGLYLGNLSFGAAVTSAPLSETWTLVLTGQLAATGLVGVGIRPGETRVLAAPPDGRFEIAAEGRPDPPWLLLGAGAGTRLEVGGLRLSLALEWTDETNVTLGIATLPSADRGGLALTIDPAEADPFARAIVPQPLQADADLDVRWSARGGLVLSELGLELVIPIDRTVGPVTLEVLHLAFVVDAGKASLLLALTGGAAVGPFSAEVADIGVELELVPRADHPLVGDLGVTAAFHPPTGGGLGLDVDGLVTAAGYYNRDPATERYGGAVAIEFLHVGLSAIVVIDTRLRQNPDGFALFASVFATFPGLPLGFGFFLSGVGGVVSLNRTIDLPALADGLRSGAADAILFPDDPVVDAPLLISQLDAWFPLAEGNTVLAVAATITWGLPTALVTGEVGVILSIPDLALAVLGTVSIALPDEELALIELHMDTLGTIDVAEATVSITGSLYDSSLVHAINLSGDMALIARFDSQPFFLLSVGGFNPSFNPPGGTPATVTDLGRMRAEVTLSEDLAYTLEAYVAVTSNTLQFGARASVEASTRFLLVTYTARGSVGFDVMLVFSPFEFVADIDVSVEITAGSDDNELVAATLSASLAGPRPWTASGRASFTFLGVDVPFHVEVGSPVPAEARPTANVLDLVLAALGEPTAWRGTAPASDASDAVVLAQAGDETEARVRPEGGIEAVQTVAPLDRAIDRYGVYAIEGPAELDIKDAGITTGARGHDAVDWEAVLDWFAPSQYDAMDRTAQLSADSYEQMASGIRLSSSAATTSDPAETRALTPTYEVAILEPETTRPLADGPLAMPLAAATAILALNPARRRHRRRSASTGAAFGVGPTTWTVADATAGAALRGVGTYRTASRQLSTIVHQDASRRGTARLVKSHAVLDGASP